MTEPTIRRLTPDEIRSASEAIPDRWTPGDSVGHRVAAIGCRPGETKEFNNDDGTTRAVASSFAEFLIDFGVAGKPYRPPVAYPDVSFTSQRVRSAFNGEAGSVVVGIVHQDPPRQEGRSGALRIAGVEKGTHDKVTKWLVDNVHAVDYSDGSVGYKPDESKCRLMPAPETATADDGDDFAADIASDPSAGAQTENSPAENDDEPF